MVAVNSWSMVCIKLGIQLDPARILVPNGQGTPFAHERAPSRRAGRLHGRLRYPSTPYVNEASPRLALGCSKKRVVQDYKQLVVSKHRHAYVYGIDLDLSASKQS